MQKNRRHLLGMLALWTTLIVMIIAVIYLSFQNGTEAKQLGQDAVRCLAQWSHPDREVTVQEINTWTYAIRQIGRIAIFFMIGVIGTIAVHTTCKKGGWFKKTLITGVILLPIAYLTEKLKIFIPSRHYSYEEMLMSVLSVTGGFLLVSFITLIARALRGERKLKSAVH